jgi:hypothetical protein
LQCDVVIGLPTIRLVEKQVLGNIVLHADHKSI